MMKKPTLLLFLICAVLNVAAQDNFFPDGEHLSKLRKGAIVKVEFFSDKVVDTLMNIPPRDAQAHILSPDGSKALLISGRTPLYRHSSIAEYKVADFTTGSILSISPSICPDTREAAFSPDGSRIAFVRENDLFYTEPDTGDGRRITRDGKTNHIINGVTDWVYEEEYGFTRAFEWSPDSRRIAFLRFDESRVREFSMMRYEGRLYPETRVFKYPKAGELNSVVTLHVYDIETGQTRTIDTGHETDQYIPRIGWTPSGDLFFYRINRLQNHFEVLLANADGTTRVIYDETSPTYVERPDEETITFLPDGDRFIVKNETRTGWMHLYLHSIKKGFLNAITSGEWEVTELLGVREGRVWYMSTEVSPLTRNFYTARVDGKKKTSITNRNRTYYIKVTPGLNYYEETYSSIQDRSMALHRHVKSAAEISDPSPDFHKQTPAGGAVISAIPAIKGDPELFSFTTDEGIELYGYMITPANFDPEKQYPLFMTQYSGPGSQSAGNAAIGESNRMIFNPLLEAGYIVACVDGRGTGFRGEAFKKCTYGQLGKLETEDQIAAAKYLGALPYIDASRIGIYGWSYGGFMALNCILKGANVFKLAVAVAPVTSWRYYDTIYTEIYNGLPKDNPSGYDNNSPINFANLLQGELLLIHGSGDDNVHVQNSYEMAGALVKAGKQFDMMIYPDDNHSMLPTGSINVRRKIADYVIKNL